MKIKGIEGNTDSFEEIDLGGEEMLIFFTVGKMGNADGMRTTRV